MAACKEASGASARAAQAGIAARSLARGYAPDKAFVIVTLVVTGVLLVGWRAGLAAATPQVPQGATRDAHNTACFALQQGALQQGANGRAGRGWLRTQLQ